ncbi:hypothetical protein [Paenibacillus agaridevorans]|uniref:hypothetical protein n=1 Tax=Paenibacillus agaridevorans TaxID=171404 RepID=UPI001BE493E2|nr:hypothetical protein [Paenibacillus agaridevorans]
MWSSHSGNKARKLVTILLLMSMLAISLTVQPRVAVANAANLAFEFNTDDDLQGWATQGHRIATATVNNGALHLSSNGPDFYWHGPTLGLLANPAQMMILRVKSDQGNHMTIYYDTDLSPGLSEQKSIKFGIIPDGEYHEYLVPVGHQSLWEGIIQEVRLDLEPENSFPANVSLDYIRFVTVGSEFNGTSEGWIAANDVDPFVIGSNDISTTVTGANPYITSPYFEMDVEQAPLLQLRMSATAGSSIAVYFDTGSSSPNFSEDRVIRQPITADGQFHEYTFNMWSHPAWNNEIGHVRLVLEGEISELSGTEWTIDYLRFPTTPPARFDWNFDYDTHGWRVEHSLDPLTIVDGELRTKVAGDDPYMSVSDLKAIVGERYGEMAIRMRATEGVLNASLFFGTEQAPEFSGERRFDFDIIADGLFHEYIVPVGQHEQWIGNITDLRLDLEGGDFVGADWAIDYIYFVPKSTDYQFLMKRSQPSITEGEDVVITAEIKNAGGKLLPNTQVEIELPAGLQLIEGNTIETLGDIELAGHRTLNWKVRGVTAGGHSITLKMNAYDLTDSQSLPLPVLGPLPAINAVQPNSVTASIDPVTGDAVIQNEKVRAIFPRDTFGYGQYSIYTWSNNDWVLMGSVQPFAYAVVRQITDVKEAIGFYPTNADAQVQSGKAILTMSGMNTDSSGRQWQHSFSFELSEDDTWIDVNQQVTANSAADLLNLSGPVLTVGQNSFGTVKEEALFPGLEWLVDDEFSSSQLDSFLPHSNRYVPHPYKITIPLMAVKSGGNLISLMWDPNQLWDGTNSLPSARFASPNWVESQNNHVMGLSALSVPTWINENEELAYEAYPLVENSPLTLQASIAASTSSSILDAIDIYRDKHEWPDAPAGHNFANQVDLGLDAYLDTYWVPDEKGWRHVDGLMWPSSQYPSNLVLLRLLGMSDPTKRADADLIINEVLNNMPDKTKLGKPDGHVTQFQSPFYFGYMDEAFEGLENRMQTIIQELDSSGVWRMRNSPLIAGTPLGVEGEPVFGVTAEYAQTLLQYANMTGDVTAAQTGLSGLIALESMGDVPRGAQIWEVPVHTPDIFASAKAVGAYLEAYKWTNDQQHLDKAIKWARTGLPFIYLWEVPDRPMTPYATISVYGSSLYTNPWFGTPVWWTGLAYSYELLELSRYDQTLPWRDIAEGILASAEMTQSSEVNGQSRGGYPDNWNLMKNASSAHVMINPEALLKNVFLQQAIDGLAPEPDFSTTVISNCQGNGQSSCVKTRIASLANIQSQGPGNPVKLVKFNLTYPSGETTYTLVSEREKPSKIKVNGTTLNEVADINSAATGWSYDTVNGYLVLKIQHAAADNVKIHYP